MCGILYYIGMRQACLLIHIRSFGCPRVNLILVDTVSGGSNILNSTCYLAPIPEFFELLEVVQQKAEDIYPFLFVSVCPSLQQRQPMPGCHYCQRIQSPNSLWPTPKQSAILFKYSNIQIFSAKYLIFEYDY